VSGLSKVIEYTKRPLASYVYACAYFAHNIDQLISGLEIIHQNILYLLVHMWTWQILFPLAVPRVAPRVFVFVNCLWCFAWNYLFYKPIPSFPLCLLAVWEAVILAVVIRDINTCISLFVFLKHRSNTGKRFMEVNHYYWQSSFTDHTKVNYWEGSKLLEIQT
jgi:hypothetical protein